MNTNTASLPQTAAPFARRAFLKGALAAGALPFLPSGAPAQSAAPAGAPAQSAAPAGKRKNTAPKYTGQKIRVAYIGIGNQGRADITQFEATGITEVVALCDTELGHHRTVSSLAKFPKAKLYRDFRRCLEENAPALDAVLVATPDFSHFPAVIYALSLGLHVYVEKPIAHSFDQIERLIAASKKYKTRSGGPLVTQMGNQGHSSSNYFQFKAWTDAGVVKNITRINAHFNNARRWHWSQKPHFQNLSGYLPAEKTPDWLDWNAWLATATEHPCNTAYLDGEWRCWFDFGNGAIGDWGAHLFDTAHEFLQLGLPSEISALRLDGANPFVFPQATTLRFKFPQRSHALPACDLWWFDGVDNLPPLPDAPAALEVDASIPVSGGGSDKRAAKAPPPGKELYSADGSVFQGGSHGAVIKKLNAAPGESFPGYTKAPASDHYGNFLRAILGEEKAHSPFAVSGPLCQTMALGVIAQRVCKPGDTLKFDAASKRITNNPVADALLTHAAPRPAWSDFYTL